jgi:type IV pilus assembly protein PilM
MSGEGKARARPKVACEVAANRVIAARAAPLGQGLDLCTCRAIGVGTVHPGLAAGNVGDAAELRQAIANALGPVAGRSRDVIAILPDAAVRVSLLEFENFPQHTEDATSLVRFRLRKTLPFDVEHAAISYHVQRPQGTFAAESGRITAVVAVAPRPVVEEYETAFRDAGYTPGVVVPSMLAVLGAVDALTSAMIVKTDVVTTTVAIVDRNELRLYRTLENQPGTGDDARLADEIYPSVVFFKDTYGSSLDRVLLAGQLESEGLGAALETQIGVRAEPLVSRAQMEQMLTRDHVPVSALAGVLGALA